jgi:hypothetical protein
MTDGGQYLSSALAKAEAQGSDELLGFYCPTYCLGGAKAVDFVLDLLFLVV